MMEADLAFEEIGSIAGIEELQSLVGPEKFEMPPADNEDVKAKILELDGQAKLDSAMGISVSSSATQGWNLLEMS